MIFGDIILFFLAIILVYHVCIDLKQLIKYKNKIQKQSLSCLSKKSRVDMQYADILILIIIITEITWMLCTKTPVLNYLEGIDCGCLVTILTAKYIESNQFKKVVKTKSIRKKSKYDSLN